jgi:hypothetical protein
MTFITFANYCSLQLFLQLKSQLDSVQYLKPQFTSFDAVFPNIKQITFDIFFHNFIAILQLPASTLLLYIF